jgi:hypothetical protein
MWYFSFQFPTSVSRDLSYDHCKDEYKDWNVSVVVPIFYSVSKRRTAIIFRLSVLCFEYLAFKVKVLRTSETSAIASHPRRIKSLATPLR